MSTSPKSCLFKSQDVGIFVTYFFTVACHKIQKISLYIDHVPKERRYFQGEYRHKFLEYLVV